ncbi:MAG TPA: hypothetical protein VN820_01790 [Acidimicrobiales bacterium]|nr:hypothetical protein [Acidimicrobiales bacterium]
MRLDLTDEEADAIRYVAANATSNASRATAFPSFCIDQLRAVAERIPRPYRCPSSLAPWLVCEHQKDERHVHHTRDADLAVQWSEVEVEDAP